MSEYPLTSFRFKVEFEGFTSEDDMGFQEVSGLELKIEADSLPLGGGGLDSYQLPSRTSHSHLILKRAVRPGSALSKWVREALEDFVFSPRLATISLLDADFKPLMVWQASQAWPVGWSLSPFNALSSDPLIETLTLAYAALRLQKG